MLRYFFGKFEKPPDAVSSTDVRAYADGIGSSGREPSATTIPARITTLPGQPVRSLTWDRDKEMAQHAQFTIDTALQIYICDPRSPCRRGTNESTNGSLRQYLPKFADLRPITKA